MGKETLLKFKVQWNYNSEVQNFFENLHFVTQENQTLWDPAVRSRKYFWWSLWTCWKKVNQECLPWCKPTCQPNRRNQLSSFGLLPQKREIERGFIKTCGEIGYFSYLKLEMFPARARTEKKMWIEELTLRVNCHSRWATSCSMFSLHFYHWPRFPVERLPSPLPSVD